jgi:hypothetical protein
MIGISKESQLKKNKEPRKKRCEECDELFTPTRELQPCCDYACEVMYIDKHLDTLIDDGKKRNATEINKKKRTFVQNDKSKQREKAVYTFNKYIRLRDKDLPCISCGHTDGRQFHAGHFKPAGGNPHLRFNELNVHKQCSICNNYKSGNLVPYRANLIIKIGLINVEALESDKSIKKYSIDDYKNIIVKYQNKIKGLES